MAMIFFGKERQCYEATMEYLFRV